MAFCSSCGSELLPGARFCSSCGAPVAAAAPATAAVPVYTATGDMDYGVVMYSIGTCARSYADDVLEDILGYTDSEAKTLVRTAPTQIAQRLTMEQAQYIAQALTEYGMQVAVYKGENPVDLSQNATQSVFNSDGSFVTGVLTALAGMTLANRITRPRRWTRPNLLQILFAPRYRSVPPRHVTRIAPHRPPEPLRWPGPRRMSIPQQQPKRRIGSFPARGVQPGRNGGPGGGGKGGRGR